MESMLETLDLDLEESQELGFKVAVEGAEAPAKVRLVCESGDLAFMFNGFPTSEPGVVHFNIPVMKDKLKEGVYLSRVEVLIENRYFAPVQFNLNFKKAVKVVAEAIVTPAKKSSTVSVSAVPIVVSKPVAPPPAPKPVVVEAPKPAPKQPVVAEKKAPPPARLNAALTLKERYHQKISEELDAEDVDAIRQLARTFVKTNKK